MSTTNSNTSLSATACSTCVRIARLIGSFEPGTRPAVLTEPEAPAIPCRGRKMRVPRDPRLRVHDGEPPADDPVEQRRLADVGPANDRDRKSTRLNSSHIPLSRMP